MDKVKIVEVGPRDGLQNSKKNVPTEVKIQLIKKLIEAGLQEIEATSFVPEKWVPQMADHAEVVKQLSNIEEVRFPVLIPNLKGLHHAIQCHVKDVAVFAAASETFSQKNLNRSIITSLNEYQNVITQARAEGIRVRGYVSCVLGCPYEGHVPLKKVVEVANALYLAGCEEISLGDTIGVGTPLKAREMVTAVADVIPIDQLAVHFHDTYGQALANIFSCLEIGVKKIDSAIAGLGGCPYAKGATGNVATEDVVYMLEGMGITTGLNLEKLIEAGEYICQFLQQANQSKVAIAMIAKKH